MQHLISNADRFLTEFKTEVKTVRPLSLKTKLPQISSAANYSRFGFKSNRLYFFA